jgi:phosphatidylserine/phosphatidylglycerophosphate/cardiolipin synthase-like enzyme
MSSRWRPFSPNIGRRERPLERFPVKHWCRPVTATLLAVMALCVLVPARAFAQPPAPGLCDPGATDCRTFLLDYISKETVGIDVAFWFMEDARYTTALSQAKSRGVRIRVLVDPRANDTNRYNATRLAELQAAGIPMRKRTASGILHWKTMIFASQGVVEFSGANYSADAWRPADPNQPFGNYTDESIYFSTTPSIFHSFQSKYDDLWTDTVNYANYANVTPPLTRSWGPPVTKDPELNFPPGESYASRALARYKAEVPTSTPTPGAIDVIMYRITDARHADAMIAAVQRGVPVRLITEPEQYRDVTRLWHSYNIDRMYMGGVAIRQRTHAGLNHQKSILLKGQGMVIFGSSNWSTASDNSQQEHNYFTTRPELFSWFVNQFERKWNNPAENGDFAPLPPDNPVNKAPANGATAQQTSATLQWYGGPWAHKYDVYLGTSPNPPLVAADLQLGPSESTTELQSYTVNTPLLPGTTYYWRIVSKTMANVAGTGPTFSFTTAGQAPPPSVNGTLGPGDILLYASKATAKAGTWTTISDGTAANGSAMWQPDAAAAKITTPLASPTHYFDLTFTPQAGVPYHLWIRGKADKDSWSNDSVYLQFSNSVDNAGAPIYRINSTSATTISLEDCSGCGVHGWGWQDNAYGTNAFGPPIIFNSSSPQTLRVQAREDGIRIDQILLSPQTFVTSSPGALKDDTTIYPEVTNPAPPAATLVRQPYLQMVGPDRATIVWTTHEPGPSSVAYSKGTGTPISVAAVSTLFQKTTTGEAADYYQHVATITGLTASTTYQYHVITQNTDLNPPGDRLVTAPAIGTGTVHFVALADSGTGSADQRQIASLIRGETFDLMLHGGDLAYGSSAGVGDGTYQTLEDWFFSIYADSLRSHPVFPAMGNHDVQPSNNNGQHYLDAFVLPTNGASATFPDHAERYYSFDYGPMHVTVLDTELAFQGPDTTRRQAQLAWADADLSSTTQPWKIAMFHRPPYSSGGEHGSDLEVRQAFDPIFERNGVQLVITGHEHDYERTVPINVSNPSGAGVTYIVTGGGGAPLYPSGSDTWTAYSESRHEYLRGSADACTLDIQAVGADSAVFDGVTLTQCAAPPDTENPTAAISTPASGANVSGIVEVDVAATDNVAVTGVDLLVDGTVIASDGEEPFQFFVDSRLLSNGGHSLKAQAFDAAGNTGLSATVAITVTNAAPDTQAPTASISSPADGSTVTDDSTVNVDAADNVGVTRVELWVDGSLSSTDATAPFSFTIRSLNLSTGTHTLQAKAYDAAGNTGASSVVGVTLDRTTPPASDIVLYAADASVRVGSWVVVNDTTAAGGTRLRNPNASAAKIVTASANPASYFEMTFNANAGQRYHLWMRGKADSNSYTNDSVFVQFDGTVDSGGNPVYRIGTTSAAEYNLEDCSGCGVSNWGWQDNGYAGFGLDLYFATTGQQTLRIQVREDGLSLDQIVLSPSTYLTTAPGPLKNDNTILPKSGTGPAPDTTPPPTSIASPANGAQVSGTVNVMANASDNIGVAHVDLYVDGALIATTTSAPYTFSWNTTGLSSGPHTLQTRAYDAANNVGTSGTTSVTVSAPSTGPAEIVLYASDAPIRVGNWTVVADATAAGGSRLRNPNVGAAKVVTASASPADYVEVSFQADPDVPYHLWIRGKADSNNYANDSVFVQFSDAKDQNGAPIYGIGTTSATEYNLEDCSGCGVSNWGWQDNGYGGMGLNITFANGGVHTMRIQTREDGLSIDQIVLSPARFLTASPGALKNDTTILPKQ